MPDLYRNVGAASLLATLCWVCVFGWGAFRFGSLRMTLAYFSGSVIAPETAEIDLGEVGSGEEMTVEFRVRNLSARPVTILGANSDCGCLVLDLPKTVDGFGVTSVRIGFTAPSRAANRQVAYTAVLILDTDAPPVLLRAVALVVEAE